MTMHDEVQEQDESGATSATGVDEIAPVVREVVVGLDPARAWSLFAERPGEWWPVATHSIGGSTKVAALDVEGRPGGQIVERWHDGSSRPWATLTAWEPPSRLVMDWHVAGPDVPATEVEVTFSPTAEGGTLVTLVHRGWERLGPQGAAQRSGYDTGWVTVLAPYVTAAGG